MDSQTTLDHLLKLNLRGMARAYQGVLSMPVQDHPSLNEFISPLGGCRDPGAFQSKDRTIDKVKVNYVIMQPSNRYIAALPAI